jgi:predicted metal-dependent phosphotriesterase family hydrolase
MTRLRTVTGSVPVSAIEGPVLAHEHLQLDLRWPVRAASDPYRWLDEESRVGAELRGLREDHDLSLVVDLTGQGMGRGAATLSRVSAGSRVAVVAATGLLAEPFHPEWVRDAGIEKITQRFLAEIGFGLDGTSILPGVIGEVGTWDGPPSPQEERCVRAAARAGLESGLSVATHGTAGLALLEILAAEGLSADRVAVGHQQRVNDPGVHRKIAEAGAYVSFSRLRELRPVLELLDAGFADRILLSGGVSRMTDLRAYGGPGYGRLFDTTLPALRAAGVGEATLRLIMHDNPLRWLAAGAEKELAVAEAAA